MVCPGGGFVPGSSAAATVPGLTTTEKRWVFADGAARPGDAGRGSAGGDGSVGVGHQRADLVVLVDAGARRLVAFAGAVQVWAVEDRSDQELTSQEPACVTGTVGELWLVAVVAVPAVWADAVTEELPPVLR